MNTKVEEALDVWEAGDLGYKEACYRKCDVDRRIAQQDATIARMREAVVALAHASLGDDTYRAAYVAASQSLATLNQENANGS